MLGFTIVFVIFVLYAWINAKAIHDRNAVLREGLADLATLRARLSASEESSRQYVEAMSAAIDRTLAKS